MAGRTEFVLYVISSTQGILHGYRERECMRSSYRTVPAYLIRFATYTQHSTRKKYAESWQLTDPRQSSIDIRPAKIEAEFRKLQIFQCTAVAKMPRIDNDVKLDFKDVLLRPKRSTLKSRSEVEAIRRVELPIKLSCEMRWLAQLHTAQHTL